jgi:hypothetical protein
MLGLTKSEVETLKKLSSPIKIQDFLDTFPVNLERKGETYMSPGRTLRTGKMHCFEGALVAAASLWLQGEPALLFDLQAPGDLDHVVALYKKNGCWGAISKTNHAALRFRDPVYRTLRELALSYFHEYFEDKYGKKTLRRCSSKPFNLKKYGTGWITSEEDLFFLKDELDFAPHQKLFPLKNIKYLRKADKMERRAGKITEWKRSDPRT